jgi:hypothetical protein
MKNIFAPLVIGVLIAAALNQVLFFVARDLLGEPFMIDFDGAGGAAGMPVAVFAPALFSVFQGVVGGVLVAALAMVTKRPKANWLWFTLVALALTFVPTAFATAGAMSTFLWLSAMHVVAGALIIPLVHRALPAVNEKKTSDSEVPSGDPSTATTE